jgi:FKBP-type peptidyl-prolyl cis-trans isomerase
VLIKSFLIIGFLSSCMKKEEIPSPEETLKKNLELVDNSKLQQDIKAIDDSLAAWNISALIEPNGCRYTIETEGTGPKPALSNYVKMKYVGKLLSNRNVFDQSNELTYPLNGFILGWQTTIPLLPSGTKATLYIPSGLAYGTREMRDDKGNLVIPANSNLIFEIELLEVL